MTCKASRDFGTRNHECACKAQTSHATAHECRCGRSWWNESPSTPPADQQAVGARYGMVWVEGKGYTPKGKAHAYQALGLKVHWGTGVEAPPVERPDTDTRILQYKD